MTVSNDDVRQTTEGDGSNQTFPFSFSVRDATDLLVLYTDSSGVELELVDGSDYETTLTGGGAGGGSIELSVITPAVGEWITLVCRPAVTQDLDLASVGVLPSQSIEDSLDKLTRLVRYVILDQLETRVIRRPDGAVNGEDHPHDAGGYRIENVSDPTGDQDAATKAYVAAQILAAEITPGTISNLSAFSALRLADPDAASWLTGLGFSAYWKAIIDETSLSNALAAMGFSSLVQDILKRSAAGSILTDLGFPFFAQSFVIAATSAAVGRNLLKTLSEVHQENLVVNGDFQVWQAAGTSISAPADDSYTADQWIFLYDTAGASPVDLTRLNTSGPSLSRSYLRATVRAGGANRKFGFLTPLDSQSSIPLRSTHVSLSVALRANSDLTGFKLMLLEWTGAADTITSDVVSAWNAATVDPTLAGAGSWAVVGTANLAITGTGSWATFKIEGNTVGASANNLAIFLVTSDGGWSDGASVDIGEVELVRGDYAVPFRGRPLEQEIRLCERFFQKTFPLDTAPASSAGLAGALTAQMNAQGSADPRAAVYWGFRTRMRATPVVSTYNPSNAGTGWDEIGGANNPAATTLHEGENGVFIYSATLASSIARFAIHGTADIRL